MHNLKMGKKKSVTLSGCGVLGTSKEVAKPINIDKSVKSKKVVSQPDSMKKPNKKDLSTAQEKPLKAKPPPRSKAVDLFSKIFSDEESSSEDEPTSNRNITNKSDKLRSKTNKGLVEDNTVLGDEIKDEVCSNDEDSELEVVGIGVRPRRIVETVKDEVKEELSSDDEQNEDNEEMDIETNEWEVKDNLEDSEVAPGQIDSDEDIEEEVNNDADLEEGGTTRTAIRKELSTLSFEELLEIKNKMGTKQYNEAMFGKQSRGGNIRGSNQRKKVFKRDNKNRPRELPARVHVPRVREVVHVKKVVRRDPRFEEGCGELDSQIWDKNYEFLKEIQHKEAQELAKTVKTMEDPEKRSETRKYLQKLKNKEKSDSEKAKQKMKRQKEIEENKKRLAEGKNPYYMKKSTRKLVDLAEKYEELKASGKLEKYLKKKRKENLIKDKKALKMGKVG